MPEGHTIHRAARDHRKVLAGQVLGVSSPQGRFAEGAKRIDGLLCTGVEAYGKHLIYHFEQGLSLHIHLGLFGKLRKSKLPLSEPKGAVRVRLVGPGHVIDINGPNTCEVLDEPELLTLTARIGPDVLRADADRDRAYHRISKSKAPIGRLIMDQSVMAGIGNIYRTEILWRLAIHPFTPGRELNRGDFDRLWEDAVALLEIGVWRNSIITTELVPKGRGRLTERVNIFGKKVCPKCKGNVECREIANRKVYLCEACQPAV
ncbi:DNA-formamidopyrimidine glycosylase family protein [Roseibium sp. HPY-6]|uniref:Fpg/Nei family DNA glycosylase n=1 Tax=Roseibium sp. HPY-6 TaxID=3229852 RepID=UPI00338E8B73